MVKIIVKIVRQPGFLFFLIIAMLAWPWLCLFIAGPFLAIMAGLLGLL